jgi:hypothetical protein
MKKTIMTQKWTDQPCPRWSGPEDNAELIKLALNSKSAQSVFNGKATFADLWNNNIEVLAATYPSNSTDRSYDYSSADAALAQHLAFWTGNNYERILTIMQESKLYREKWNREDYLRRTILNACARQTEWLTDKSNQTTIPQLPIENISPEPLPELPAVLSFDYSYLPDVLREYVRDISERMQCPPDFAAVAVFIMIATLCGRKIGLRPMKHNDWTVIPNLWGAVIGNSGVMKSPTLHEALFPLKQLAAKAQEAFNKEIEEYNSQVELAKLQESVNKTEARKALKGKKSDDAKSLLKSSEIGNKPIAKRFITNNSTYEALGELLIENPNGVMVEADEIIGLLKQLDASGQEVARSFYLTAADGDKPYTLDRIMRGKGLHIEAVCLSIIGGIQPGILAEYVRQAINGGASADGLIQRFGLIVYPDISSNWKEVDRYPDSTARQAVNMLAEKLNNLSPGNIRAETDPYGGVPFLRFSDVAQTLFSEWRTELEHRLRSNEEHPAIVSHLAKYRKLVPSLALLNHLCDVGHGLVSEVALQRAINFSNYLESHARRIYSFATRPDIDAAKTVLKRLTSGKLLSPFSARGLYKKGWAGLTTPNQAKAVIDLLIEYGHLLEEKRTTEGRPTEVYHWVQS